MMVGAAGSPAGSGPLQLGAAEERDAAAQPAGDAGGPQLCPVSVPAERTAVWPSHLPPAASTRTLRGWRGWGRQPLPGRRQASPASVTGSLVSVGR